MDYTDRSERVVREYNRMKEQKIKADERLAVLKDRMRKEYGVDSLSALRAKAEECARRADELSGRIEPLLSSLEDKLGIPCSKRD